MGYIGIMVYDLFRDYGACFILGSWCMVSGSRVRGAGLAHNSGFGIVVYGFRFQVSGFGAHRVGRDFGRGRGERHQALHH